MANLSAIAERPVSLPDTIPPDWKWQSLIDCCRPKQWPTIGKKELLPNGYEVYGANGFIGYYSKYTHKNQTIAITCRGATCGTVNLVPPQTYITGNAMALDDVDIDRVSQPFLYYALIQRALSDVVSGSAQPQITGQGLKKVLFPLPPLPEQKKIAGILGSVDEAIAKTEAVIAQTQRVKQGLLQTLLTRGIGHTKFKQTELGEIPESWDVQKVADIAQIKVGKDLVEDKFSESQTEEHCYPVYSNTVSNYGLYGFYSFEEYDGNSLTVVGRGIGLGKAFARNASFGAIGRLLVISPKDDEFDVRFLAEYINSRLQIHNESGGIPQLPGTTFGKYKVALPPLAEQKEIADALSCVDDTATNHHLELTELKKLKKGLMADLLTGRVRVDVGLDTKEEVA